MVEAEDTLEAMVEDMVEGMVQGIRCKWRVILTRQFMVVVSSNKDTRRIQHLALDSTRCMAGNTRYQVSLIKAI